MKLTGLAALALALCLPAAPAFADEGRALLPTGIRPVPLHIPDASGAQVAVALPDGGVVLFTWGGPGRGAAGVRMLPDGTPDATFGQGGVARIGSGARTLIIKGALRRPDGRLLLSATELPTDPVAREEIVLAQLTADGAPDAAFGQGGIVRTGVSGFSRAALAPDGAVVVSGTSGATAASQRWVVARFTATGTPDPAFGANGTLVVPGSRPGDDGRVGAHVAPDGRITALGGRLRDSLVARLLPDGTADPSWGGGAPVALGVDANDFAVAANGSLTALGATRVERRTPTGVRDAVFGGTGLVDVGDASFGRLLAEPDGGVIVYRTPAPQPRPSRLPALVLDRLSATGARTTATPAIRLGGGATNLGSTSTRGLRQSGFAVGSLIPRPDGSYLAAGGVSLIQYVGEGEGTSVAQHAVVALTPQLTVDRSFGPAFARPRAAARPGRTERSRHVVRLRVRASGPGLLRVRVADRRGHRLAGGIVPVYAAGDHAVRVRTTPRGRRALRHHVAVRVTGTFRDLATRTVRAKPRRGRL